MKRAKIKERKHLERVNLWKKSKIGERKIFSEIFVFEREKRVRNIVIVFF